MPKSPNFDESRMAEAFAAAIAQKKPNLSKIAREFGVYILHHPCQSRQKGQIAYYTHQGAE
jgi:hypothetical protein